MNPRPIDSSIPSTVAGYLVRPVTFAFDGLRVRLLMVKRLEDYVDTEALLRDPQAPEPPYWAHLWPGSRYLAQVMAQNECVGRQVVDIGCGLGLAGMVSAMRGALVTMIDAAGDGVRFARANAALNGLLSGPPPFAEGLTKAGSVAVVQGDIRSPGLRGRFDYCLAADVTYDPALQTAVAAFLAEHLSATGRAWCAESVRTLDQGFRRACEARGLRATESEVRELDEQGEVPVRVTQVRWPESETHLTGS